MEDEPYISRESDTIWQVGMPLGFKFLTLEVEALSEGLRIDNGGVIRWKDLLAARVKATP